jgi:polyphosphate kinase
MFPVEDPRLQARLVDGILGVYLADNVKARVMRPDGTYERLAPADGGPRVRAQVEFQNLARELHSLEDAPARVPSFIAQHTG